MVVVDEGGIVAGVAVPGGAHEHVVISGVDQAIALPLLVVAIEVALVDAVPVAEGEELGGVAEGQHPVILSV